MDSLRVLYKEPHKYKTIYQAGLQITQDNIEFSFFSLTHYGNTYITTGLH